jgi:hypothetical protein
MRLKLPALIVLASLMIAKPVESQNVPAVPPTPQLSYADLADLALAAPVAAQLRIRDADALHPDEAPNVAPGFRRFLVVAEVAALIRGDGGLPPQVSYLVDLPNDSRGHAARLRRHDEVLVLARRVPNRPAELRLVAPDAQLPYAPATAERLRAILRDAAAAGAPPRITGIGRAFHVPGSLPGESETQIFLQTADGRPISLSILRRPGERPRWSVALSEIVDEAAAPPAPDTLLWYRLACTLPPRLPPEALSEAGAEEAPAIQADYRLVMDGLGRCLRSRARR